MIVFGRTQLDMLSTAFQGSSNPNAQDMIDALTKLACAVVIENDSSTSESIKNDQMRKIAHRMPVGVIRHCDPNTGTNGATADWYLFTINSQMQENLPLDSTTPFPFNWTVVYTHGTGTAIPIPIPTLDMAIDSAGQHLNASFHILRGPDSAVKWQNNQYELTPKNGMLYFAEDTHILYYALQTHWEAIAGPGVISGEFTINEYDDTRVYREGNIVHKPGITSSFGDEGIFKWRDASSTRWWVGHIAGSPINVIPGYTGVYTGTGSYAIDGAPVGNAPLANANSYIVVYTGSATPSLNGIYRNTLDHRISVADIAELQLHIDNGDLVYVYEVGVGTDPLSVDMWQPNTGYAQHQFTCLPTVFQSGTLYICQLAHVSPPVFTEQGEGWEMMANVYYGGWPTRINNWFNIDNPIVEGNANKFTLLVGNYAPSLYSSQAIDLLIQRAEQRLDAKKVDKTCSAVDINNNPIGTSEVINTTGTAASLKSAAVNNSGEAIWATVSTSATGGASSTIPKAELFAQQDPIVSSGVSAYVDKTGSPFVAIDTKGGVNTLKFKVLDNDVQLDMVAGIRATLSDPSVLTYGEFQSRANITAVTTVPLYPYVS